MERRFCFEIIIGTVHILNKFTKVRSLWIYLEEPCGPTRGRCGGLVLAKTITLAAVQTPASIFKINQPFTERHPFYFFAEVTDPTIPTPFGTQSQSPVGTEQCGGTTEFLFTSFKCSTSRQLLIIFFMP